MSNLKIAVIGNPGSWSTEKLANAIARKTGFRCVVEMSEVTMDLNQRSLFHNDLDLASLDGLVIKKIGPVYSPDMFNRLEILRFFCKLGIPVYSRPQKIMAAINRLSCTVTLQKGDIPMPPTVITENIDQAVNTVKKFGKAVFKPLYSSKARGMMVVEDYQQCTSMIENFQTSGNTTMYIQKMVNIPGQDLGVAFLGGRYVGTYARKQGTSWNTCTSSGGRYEPFDPGPEIIDLARKAQDLFGLDFTCVDVVETEDGPMVFEVSAFGGFRGLSEACGIDAAELYADHVVSDILS
ncbi:GAK system ATP-grasp enzyme [Desulfonatronovibrio hydrogenovorans]|uniref:GAK system ATP-grasp enzyme n=1 Tax=Desulfonatronovibrio hydrogenovorans TaxID=53245 RepID=UPI000550B903|nr:GAK system ATP-grasp enzyme [Desulfonatronovibrio hydrogenovorans]